MAHVIPMMWLDENNVVSKGNSLSVELSVVTPHASRAPPVLKTREYIINVSVKCEVMVVIHILSNQSTRNILFFVRFTKVRPDDELTYLVEYNHLVMNNQDKRFSQCFCTKNDTWHLVDELKQDIDIPLRQTNELSIYATFYVSLKVKIVPPVTELDGIYDDTNLTDLELCGVDGSVHMHKVIAAVSSPYFKTMFSGVWKETKEHVAVVKVLETSKKTLQHLKDYMYLGTLPDSGLEELLLLSSCYMMPELEQRCAQKLLATVSAEKATDLIMFAAKNHMSHLLFELLDRVKHGSIDVTEMRRLHQQSVSK